MFRGEIGNFNLPVVNVKKRISPRNTRLTVYIFPWPVKFHGGFAAKNHK